MPGARAMMLCFALAIGCATAPRAAEFRHAERAYWAGEARMRSEEWSDAIALFRRAAIELPATPTYHEVHHDLVMRIAHVQLRAYMHSRDVGYLADAAQMLSRYAEHRGDDETREQAAELAVMSGLVVAHIETARRDGQRVLSEPSARYPDDAEVQDMIAAAEIPTAASRKRVLTDTRRLPGPLPVNTQVAQRGSDEFRTRLLQRGQRR